MNRFAPERRGLRRALVLGEAQGKARRAFAAQGFAVALSFVEKTN